MAHNAPRSSTRRDHARHENHLGVNIDKFAARASQTVPKVGHGVGQPGAAAGDPPTPPTANPSPPRALQLRDEGVSPPSAPSYKFFGAESGIQSSSSSLLSEEYRVFPWQTVPIVDAAFLPPGRRRFHMTEAPQIVKQETLHSESHFPVPKRNSSTTRTIKQEAQSGTQSWQPASPSPVKRTRSIMDPPGTARGGATGRGRGRGRGRRLQRRPRSSQTPTAAMGSTSSDPASDYIPPPHPYSTGKVSKVNICPICEKYTVTELDRPADSDPSGESLRTRFKCEGCSHVFDLGIPLFDPRGTPGVTLYGGEDRFVPPVPPKASYPCPKCWASGSSSFQCMTVYLKEESRLPCEPACRAGRTSKAKGVRTTARRTTRQSTK